MIQDIIAVATNNKKSKIVFIRSIIVIGLIASVSLPPIKRLTFTHLIAAENVLLYNAAVFDSKQILRFLFYFHLELHHRCRANLFYWVRHVIKHSRIGLPANSRKLRP